MSYTPQNTRFLHAGSNRISQDSSYGPKSGYNPLLPQITRQNIFIHRSSFFPFQAVLLKFSTCHFFEQLLVTAYRPAL